MYPQSPSILQIGEIVEFSAFFKAVAGGQESELMSRKISSLLLAINFDCELFTGWVSRRAIAGRQLVSVGFGPALGPLISCRKAR